MEDCSVYVTVIGRVIGLCGSNVKDKKGRFKGKYREGTD